MDFNYTWKSPTLVKYALNCVIENYFTSWGVWSIWWMNSMAFSKNASIFSKFKTGEKEKEIHLVSSRNLSEYFWSLFVFKVKSMASTSFLFLDLSNWLLRRGVQFKNQDRTAAINTFSEFIMTFAIDFRLAFNNRYLWHQRIKLCRIPSA